MTLAERLLSTAFADHEVVIQRRPDGGVLLILHRDQIELLRRAISRGQANSNVHLEWVISSIRRDLALEAGAPPVITRLQSQSRTALPKYEYR